MAVAAKKPPKPTGPLVKGLPVYTKQQFQQVRPGGSYQAYLNYINRHRGAQPGPAAGTPKLPTYQSLLAQVKFETPAQLEARAKRMAEADVTSQTAIVRADAEAAAKAARDRALALSAAGRAAASLNAGLFGMVGGEYNAGARELSALSTAGSAGMAGETAAQVAQANQRLANVGMPGVEAAGVMAGPGQAGVENFRGGTLGAQNLGTQGEAATFGLAGMVSAQNLRATQEAQLAYTQTEREIQAARAKAVAEIARGRPENANKYLLQLQDAQRQQIALAMSLIEARNARGDQIIQNRIDLAEEGRAVETHGQEMTAGNLEIAGARIALNEIDVTKSQALGYVVKKNGKPLLKNGKKIPWSVLAKQINAAEGGANGLTPNQQLEWDQTLRDEVMRMYYGSKKIKLGNGQMKTVPAYTTPGFDPDNAATWGTNPAVKWYTAIKQLKARYGISEAKAISILKEVYPRGEAGAPVFYADERAKMKQWYGAANLATATKRIRRLLSNDDTLDEADALIKNMLGHTWRPGASQGPGGVSTAAPRGGTNYSDMATWNDRQMSAYSDAVEYVTKAGQRKPSRSQVVVMLQKRLPGAPYKLILAIADAALKQR